MNRFIPYFTTHFPQSTKIKISSNCTDIFNEYWINAITD